MINIEIRGARAIEARLEGAPAVVRSALKAQLNKSAARLHHYAVVNKLTGGLLKKRSSHLIRALFWRVEAVTDGFLARIGVDVHKARYGRAHELGATITPKKGKALTIPVGEALTKDGNPRFTAREFIEQTRGRTGGSFYGFTRSFVTKNKGAIMGLRKSGDSEPVFLLRPRVELPQRPFLASTLEENRERVVADLQTSVEAAWREHMERR